jgi:hypothetical protein
MVAVELGQEFGEGRMAVIVPELEIDGSKSELIAVPLALLNCIVG